MHMGTFVNPNASVPPEVKSGGVVQHAYPSTLPGVNVGQTFKPILSTPPRWLTNVPIIGKLFPSTR